MSKADNKELEEAIYRINFHKDNAELSNGSCIVNKQDIEILLNELKRLQEENSKLERANKTYINSIQSITPVLLEDYIEKDKIREIIEKAKSNITIKGLEIIYVKDLEKLLEENI